MVLIQKKKINRSFKRVVLWWPEVQNQRKKENHNSSEVKNMIKTHHFTQHNDKSVNRAIYLNKTYTNKSTQKAGRQQRINNTNENTMKQKKTAKNIKSTFDEETTNEKKKLINKSLQNYKYTYQYLTKKHRLDQLSQLFFCSRSQIQNEKIKEEQQQKSKCKKAPTKRKAKSTEKKIVTTNRTSEQMKKNK